MTIWKFPIDTRDKQTINIPIGAKFLAVQNQYDAPCIWALVNPSAENIKTTISIYGTGQNINDELGEYLGTYQLRGGSLVFHVFANPQK